MANLFFVDDIPGFEGEYGATEEGEIYSFRSKKFLKPGRSSNGYLHVTLCKADRVSSRGKIINVHRIIALTFIPNPDDLPCVDHIDRNKSNNCVSNLRWVTHKQNESNKPSHKNTSSQYKGVSRQKGKWGVSILLDGKSIYLGRFANEEDAAEAYNNAVDIYFPESEFHYKNVF